MVSKLIEEFLNEYLSRNPILPEEKTRSSVTTRSELIEILSGMELLIRKNKDKTLEEIIELIVKDNIMFFEDIRSKYGVPGYTASIKVGNNNVKLYGGNINYLGEPMPDKALFDIASMTKFYTQIIAYNLMKENAFKRSSTIASLDDRFINLTDLTVDDILTFSVEFRTDGYIKNMKTIDKALDTLYKVKVVKTGDWNYNDMGMMIMKEVMEKVSGLSYIELVNKYIVDPLELKDTHIIVPRNKFKLITGSPNAHLGFINDMSANAVGGYSGHAGIFASSDDVIKMMLAAGEKDSKILPNNSDAYTPGKYRDSVGIMGNVYVPHITGIHESFIDTTEPIDTFAISGSTRTNAAASSDSAYTVFFNPASVSLDKAKELEVYKKFEFDRNGKLLNLDLIDPRKVLPVDSMADAVRTVSITTIKLRFLDFVMKKYEKELEEVNVVINNNERKM